MKSRWAKTPGVSRHTLYKIREAERGKKETRKKRKEKRLLYEKKEIAGNL